MQFCMMKLVSIHSVSFLWLLPFLGTSFAFNLRSDPSNVIDNTIEAAMEEDIWRSLNLFSMSMAVNDLNGKFCVCMWTKTSLFGVRYKNIGN